MCILVFILVSSFFFFKQKTAYEMRISDWSSDVCSSDLPQYLETAQVRTEQQHAFARVQVPLQLLQSVHADVEAMHLPGKQEDQIGRASCRERVCQYV